MLQKLRQTWFSNVRADVLAGLVVALALIPEAIAFSIIAGVDPKVGLYASFCICAVIAFVGGRPGMISAATGAMALLMVTLVKEHGLQYLLAATLLCGVLQILAGYLKLGSLMRFVSRSVVTGFVNALAILIFMAQLPELTNVTWHVYAMTAAGLGIIYLFPYVPKIGKLIPSPLVCILTLTAIAIYLGLDIRTVGDMGQLRCRHAWRHGRLRHDRPVDHQREIWRPHPSLDIVCRRFPAADGGISWRMALQNPYGRTRGCDDHGVHRHL